MHYDNRLHVSTRGMYSRRGVLSRPEYDYTSLPTCYLIGVPRVTMRVLLEFAERVMAVELPWHVIYPRQEYPS